MRSMVEGAARSAFFKNLSQDGLEMIANIGREKAQRLDPLRGQHSIPPLVAGRIVTHVVTCAVNLDCQSRGVAEEIERVESARVLVAELEVARAGAQLRPEPSLGW